MTFTYSVTFEFENGPPLTSRGMVSSTQAHTAASRALREAKKATDAKRWQSAVILIEKGGK